MGFSWTSDPIKQIEKLKTGLRTKAVRISLSKASASGKRAMQTVSPFKTGLTRKAIRIRIRSYKNKAVWVSVIGPSSKISRPKKRPKGYVPKEGEKPKLHRPSKIFPLLNYGTKTITARHYDDLAMAMVGQNFSQIFNDKLREQITQLLGQNK